jgi:viral A-type inclusion protein repeat, putative
MEMNDGQTGEILGNSIDKIRENRLFIIELNKKVKFLENKEKEFSEKISEIEENFKSEIKKLRDEFKNNGLNESPNTEKNKFNNSSEEMFPSYEKLKDKKEVKEQNDLEFGNENQGIELKKENKKLEEENLDLKERLENFKNEKIEEIGERDRRILELTEKNKKLEKEKNEKIDEIKKLSKDLNQEKANFDNLETKFSNFKKGAEDGFLRLNGEIKSRDVKINDLNFKINNLLREKANLEKNVDDLRREILSKNQAITHLENQVSSLTEDVRNREHKISGLENDKNKLENDKNNLISRLADFKDLEELEELYSEYLKIPENDREKYDAILKPHLGKDMFLYLVTTKFSNYKDFLKNDFIENADFYAVLVKIYDYVINVMNKEYDEEVYEFLNPEIGERYNPISQIPSSNSVSNGDVARVIVKGYQRKRDKKLLYQSIVLLK